MHIASPAPTPISLSFSWSVKDKLFENMSKYQLATKPGHRATEHVFVLFSLMTQMEKNKTAGIITQYDLSKYFDRECIFDICNELYRSQVRGKAYRLIFMCNKNTRIKVKTPVGETAQAEIGPSMAQGLIIAAIASLVNFDSCVRDEFHMD